MLNLRELFSGGLSLSGAFATVHFLCPLIVSLILLFRHPILAVTFFLGTCMIPTRGFEHYHALHFACAGDVSLALLCGGAIGMCFRKPKQILSYVALALGLTCTVYFGRQPVMEWEYIPQVLGTSGIRDKVTELKDVVESVVLDFLPEQALYELTQEQCQFGYRTSYFQKTPGCVIVSAVFRLQSGDGEEIAAKMRELNAKRREKQPLDLPSAGSAFKRPEGYYAAALIEEAGLKGCTVGGAQVSEKHAGFVVNLGGASSHDVYDLMMHIRRT